ncbi:hemophore-related protein [Mycolicibacterium moriokaense]|jgi:hemophore-related protein|uniref:Membrane protein n=1 Tax=Mycolicibacterium moriokaense TaxID=39691 RepID=A0AAD1M943_9MYCO|nr:heme-binding protein [Mycolicibacterium moriokaense]MCV7037214.1 heme-binding protein [Mycolicibacterium moriokaense]ORB20960.1 hemophore-related protein [Mycolicibacterium moriokaense]BBX04170.1 membrane protein [Mycolicibacterium moriokaense]
MLNAARRLVLSVFAGTASCAALFGAVPFANAEPQNPPGCTAADLEGVRAGVDVSTSAYLFTHPDLNGFMDSLQGQSRAEVAEHITDYMKAHPQESVEMIGIRQPLMDIKNHCGALVSP